MEKAFDSKLLVLKEDAFPPPQNAEASLISSQPAPSAQSLITSQSTPSEPSLLSSQPPTRRPPAFRANNLPDLMIGYREWKDGSRGQFCSLPFFKAMIFPLLKNTAHITVNITAEKQAPPPPQRNAVVWVRS